MNTISDDVVVIGAGQAGLAAGYYVRRSGLRYRILDAGDRPGGAWAHAWPSLRLFSPAQWSSLPGWLMPRGAEAYPTRDEVIAYFAEYERRYALPVERPVVVQSVIEDSDGVRVVATSGEYRARAVIAATGTWANPARPELPGANEFRGTILHSARYAGVGSMLGLRVIVVGGGNSGAQIAAELGDEPRIAAVRWVTREPPVFLPPEVDGRFLFEQATARYRAVQEGRTPDPPRSLGDIVRVASVERALERGFLVAEPMFETLVAEGARLADGTIWPADVVILATGFRPALAPLVPLGIVEANGRVLVDGTRARRAPRLWLLGYGDWTGFASATVIGVGRAARATVEEVVAALA